MYEDKQIRHHDKNIMDFWFLHSSGCVNQVFDCWFKDDENWELLYDAAMAAGFCITDDDCENQHPNKECHGLFEPQYEKFIVDDFLAAKLKNQNEVVIEILDFPNVWIRQTFGQLVIADHVMETIFEEHSKLAL